MPDKLICAYCGKEKKEITFVIGACSPGKEDWCMIYGTGKMACPECYKKASEEGRKTVDKHVENFNRSVSTIRGADEYTEIS